MHLGGQPFEKEDECVVNELAFDQMVVIKDEYNFILDCIDVVY
jgi:hypothetical protein